MGADANKTPVEKAALLRFLDAAQIPIDRKTIVKPSGEKMPDFVGRTLNGQYAAFEVTEICDGSLPRLQDQAARCKQQFAFANPDAAEEIVRNKMHKSYSTQIPVSLVCYWADRIVSTDEEILEGIRRAVYSVSKIPFERVWHHGRESLYLVYETP